MSFDEKKIREIVREELETQLISSLRESVKEVHLLVQDIKEREQVYEKKFDGMIEELSDLKETTKNVVKISEENTRAIQELRKTTEELRKTSEENTRAIQELRKTTEELRKTSEENTRAIQELRKTTEENTKAISRLNKIVDKLVRAVEGLNRRVGGLENSFGLVVEDIVRRDLPLWFESKGVKVEKVYARTLKFNGSTLEFDVYLEFGNNLYVGEIKTTLRERDVIKFYKKVERVREMIKDKQVIPILIYRFKAEKGDPLTLAKGFNIIVLKYLKGGYFEER